MVKILLGSSLIASLALVGVVPAQAKSKRHHPHYYSYSAAPPARHVGGFAGPGTFAAAPRSYGGDPAYVNNVPVGRPDAFQGVNGCYGGREQVRRGNRLVWVPDVTCPYSQDSF